MVPNFTFIRVTTLFIVLVAIIGLTKGADLPSGNTSHKINNLSRHDQPKKYKPTNVAISWYVMANATGNNDGASWQDAFTSLTNALSNAVPGDTIRVAQGFYYTDGGPFNLKDSVVILGGYPDAGNPTDADRNYGRYQTILSGEAGNPLFPFDNASTIVNGNQLKDSTVLDGFIIENGFANNTLKGVGINLVMSSPQIRNCVFRNNSSYNTALGGSSIACQNNSNPVISNCFFVNNLDFIFSTIFSKLNCQPTFINCVFAGNNGRFVLYSNQSNVVVTNCTFFNNQIGISYLPAVLKTGFIYAENNSTLSVTNTIFFNNKFLTSTDSADISLNESAATVGNSITQNYLTNDAYLLAINPGFKDTANIAGNDNFYFTGDDGLQPVFCSPAINTGSNVAVATIFTDILQRPRVFSGQSDLGAYEYQSINGDVILNKANDSIEANREYTDQNGWTHYYNDCLLLLSVKKEGQQIGTLHDGTFKVMVNTTPGYGVATGNNLSPANYVTPGVAWNALNRYWTINATNQPVDSLLIRFPWSTLDYTDATAINTAINSPEQLVLFTVDPPSKVLGVDVPLNHFNPYYNGAVPTTKFWKYSSIDTIQYAEYYVKKLSAGGIGTGTGFLKGPFASANNSCQGNNRTFTSSITGTAYQWQMDNGSGFIDLADNTLYTGSNTQSLTLIAPPTANYGYIFRCLVTEDSAADFSREIILKFETKWTGANSTEWADPANWSCGFTPDENTDVRVPEGTLNNLNINVDASCRSLHLLPNTVVTLADDKKLTITGK